MRTHNTPFFAVFSLLFLILVTAIVGLAPASAEQMTCIDQDYIHNK